MSADFGASTPGCEGCGCTGHRLGDWNLTYNLTPMLKAAGFPGWSEVVSERRSDGLLPTGANTVPIFEAVLAELRANPEKYRAMNPPNGWGTYEGAVEVFADYIEKVGPHPDATVDSWL